ncbi:MAG: 2,3,4,5-tetrahydropyridine-2,6-dicarboxylate N-succinyltransferase [Spirochaetes bacterium]|nr:2,3,4,5-tetrahydropyridine-2,6-dicarboxylate N-succinyltransferase [Spirochaetota bacterium]MBU0955787.1 2,3,4,5-tetrahydropyridine-2,6-dicarboxylate N-succinyltransferase [Spirochaetota bacterium]
MAADKLLDLLESGRLASAEKDSNGNWQAITWVKQAILAIFRNSGLAANTAWPGGSVDKQLLPQRIFGLTHGIRIVPGGSSVRRGAHIKPGVVIMPPSYVNIGSSIGEGTMVDSHVLVGSCAQIGRRVHLSAGVQIGGVLEPSGACPVIVEDDCFLGALSGLFEGLVMRQGAVLAPGVVVSKSTRVYDLVKHCEYQGEIPAGAVVVSGSRPARGLWARRRSLSLYAPCIVKYRDAGTDAALLLEEALR